MHSVLAVVVLAVTVLAAIGLRQSRWYWVPGTAILAVAAGFWGWMLWESAHVSHGHEIVDSMDGFAVLVPLVGAVLATATGGMMLILSFLARAASRRRRTPVDQRGALPTATVVRS